MDREVVVELIQANFNYNTLKSALDDILFDSTKRNQIINDYKELKSKLGNKGASKRAAEIIAGFVS